MVGSLGACAATEPLLSSAVCDASFIRRLSAGNTPRMLFPSSELGGFLIRVSIEI